MNRPYVSAKTATYASVEAALDAAVACALPGAAIDPSRSPGARERPVTIRGVTYESRTEAAKALGVRANTIYKALKRGTVENVGLRKNAAR